MLYYNRINLSKRTDPAKNNNSKECIVWHYRFFNHGFEFHDSACNGCHDLMMLCLQISYIATIAIKGFIVALFMTFANLKEFVC